MEFERSKMHSLFVLEPVYFLKIGTVFLQMSRAVISNSVWFSLTHFRESLTYKTQDKKKAACQKFKCGKICINFSKLTNSEHGKNSVIMPEEILGDTSEEISRLRRWKKQTAYS